MAQEFDGFEVGDSDLATDGDGAFWIAGSKGLGSSLVGNEPSVVYAGAFAARLDYAFLADPSYTVHSVGTPTNSRYVQCKIRVESQTPVPTLFMHSMWNVAAALPRCRYAILAGSSTYTLTVTFDHNGGSASIGGTTVLTMGQWYTFEIQYVSNSATAGGAACWIDGRVEGVDLTRDTTQANSIIDELRLGMRLLAAPAGQIFFDNYVTSPDYIGLPPPPAPGRRRIRWSGRY